MAGPFMFDEDDTGSAFDRNEFEDPDADAEMAANDAAAEATFQAMTAPSAKPPASRPGEFKLSGTLDYMDDVIRRMNVANYYREFLANPLFENTDDDAQGVEDEIRQFCTGRLQVLMGIRADNRPLGPSKPFPLDDKAVEALKALVPYAQDLLSLATVFAPVELQALKSLAAVALKHQGKLAPKAPPARRLPTTPAEAPAAPPATRPAPVPVPVPAAPTAPATKPTLTRRGTRPGATVPVKTPAAPVPIQATVTRQVEGENGQIVEHTTKVQRIQKPTGMVPFPDQRSMEMATTNLANAQISVTDPFGKKITFNQ